MGTQSTWGSISTMRLLTFGIALLLAIALASGHRGRGHHGHLTCSNGCKPTCTDGAQPLCADGTTPTERLAVVVDVVDLDARLVTPLRKTLMETLTKTTTGTMAGTMTMTTTMTMTLTLTMTMTMTIDSDVLVVHPAAALMGLDHRARTTRDQTHVLTAQHHHGQCQDSNRPTCTDGTAPVCPDGSAITPKPVCPNTIDVELLRAQRRNCLSRNHKRSVFHVIGS